MFVPRSVRASKSRRVVDHGGSSSATEKADATLAVGKAHGEKKRVYSGSQDLQTHSFGGHQSAEGFSIETQGAGASSSGCVAVVTEHGSILEDANPNVLGSQERDETPVREGGEGCKEELDVPVVVHSFQQRNCLPGEPSCIVCGRYGEYVCDATDHDVCSLECKTVDLERSNRPSEEVALALKSMLDSEAQAHFDGSDDLRSNAGDRSHSETISGKNSLDDNWLFKKELDESEAEEVRKRFSIQVTGDGVPPTILDFEQCNFPELLVKNLYDAGYECPTPIQMQVIPAVLLNRHILTHSPTGSGKTLSYIVPIISKIQKYAMHRFRSSCLAIILSPTRELCSQIENQTKVLAKGLRLKTGLIVGGIPLPQQLHRLKQEIQLLICTPGRLIHLLSVKDVPLEEVKIIVLDEVDSMLQMGFRDQVIQIMQALYQPQILCFSATMPTSIEKFALSLLENPIRISLLPPSEAKSNVKHTVLWVENTKKKQKLLDILLSQHFHPPVLIFVESKLGADMLSEFISTKAKLSVKSIHGDKPMDLRRQIMEELMNGELPVVVSTGLLSRGLNLVSVSQVIVFDMPNSMEDYVHYIGRVGRKNGLEGFVMTFVNEDDKLLLRDFLFFVRSMGAAIPKQLQNSPYVHSTYALASVSVKKRKVHRPY